MFLAAYHVKKIKVFLFLKHIKYEIKGQLASSILNMIYNDCIKTKDSHNY